MEWISETNCVLCGSTDLEYNGFGIFPFLKFPEVFMNCTLGVITTYSKCHGCGLIFQNPHMDAEALTEFYKSGAYRQMVMTTPTATLEESLEIQDRDERYGQTLWAEYVPANVRHLDVGCSHGLMLELTRMKGCTIMGVEPNRLYVDFGVPSVGSIYEVEGQWDYITCKHVLEHVSDLTKFTARMVDLLAPGGHLLLEVPKAGLSGSSFRLQHLYTFEPDVLRRLFDGLIEVEYKENPHHYFDFQKAGIDEKLGDSGNAPAHA